jgi:hypothetical protein
VAAVTALAERGAAAVDKPGRLHDWLDVLRLEAGQMFRRSKVSIAESPLVPDDPAAVRARQFSKRSVKSGPEDSIEVGAIANVILASAVHCMGLATRAFELEKKTAVASRKDAGSAVSAADSGEPGRPAVMSPAKLRQAFVERILTEKGWSILDWADNSGVDFHTANDYLKGTTKPYRSTRKKLADSLGVAVADLPA